MTNQQAQETIQRMIDDAQANPDEMYADDVLADLEMIANTFRDNEELFEYIEIVKTFIHNNYDEEDFSMADLETELESIKDYLV